MVEKIDLDFVLLIKLIETSCIITIWENALRRVSRTLIFLLKINVFETICLTLVRSHRYE